MRWLDDNKVEDKKTVQYRISRSVSILIAIDRH
jgi:hypothetical protein